MDELFVLCIIFIIFFKFVQGNFNAAILNWLWWGDNDQE